MNSMYYKIKTNEYKNFFKDYLRDDYDYTQDKNNNIKIQDFDSIDYYSNYTKLLEKNYKNVTDVTCDKYLYNY